MERGIARNIFSKVFGIGVFLIILGVLNFLTKYIKLDFFLVFTNFLNINALLIVGIVVIFLISELIAKSEFPINIFRPLLNFIGTIMVLHFVFLLFGGINKRFNLEVLNTLFLLKVPIYITVLSLIFIFGYLSIIYKALKAGNKKEEIKDTSEVREVENKKTKKVLKKDRRN